MDHRLGRLLAPLCLALACSGVDDHGDAHHVADSDDGTALPSAAIEAPYLVGELSCEEPSVAGAVERELSPDEETELPPPSGLTELLAQIRQQGGRPTLHFDTRAAGRLLNVRVPVRADQVHRTADAVDDDVALDLGALTVRLTHQAGTAVGAPELVLPATLPLDQVVVLKTYTRAANEDGLGRARLAMVSVFDRRDEQAGPVATLAIDDQLPQAREADCDALAYELASEVPPVAVSFPRLSSCTVDECAKTRAAWLRANHDLHRVRQMLEFIAASPPEDRAYLWAAEGGSEGGERLMSYESDDVGPNTALAFYFGPYAEYRFKAIRIAYERLWRTFHDHEVGGLELDIECTPDGPGDICNTTKPGGHHAVKSNMKLCEKAYTTPSQVFDVPRLVLHESMHHMFVPWKDNLARLSPIMDTHTHGHGGLCAGKLVTDKGYGLKKIKHLASYENDRGDDCWHNNFAFRNNDTFAYAAATIGTYIRFGFLARWPLEQAPEHEDNLPDPECGMAGVNTPPPGFSDPLSKCYKSGGQLVCPGAHSPGDLDIGVICAPQ
ncbi:hypothetical protein [Nannocystis radixulma]|uniref:Uncharacterized protein n=1 Tax=Nannocystis radixulma TaxID=2995305 RepID=A0ABT5AXV6_9BACT|nr:hypothetical protein [Nannocystis radixulma]MDC0666677.1 hypothetical protein [Nannocystis radixulma]